MPAPCEPGDCPAAQTRTTRALRVSTPRGDRCRTFSAAPLSDNPREGEAQGKCRVQVLILDPRGEEGGPPTSQQATGQASHRARWRTSHRSAALNPFARNGRCSAPGTQP